MRTFRLTRSQLFFAGIVVDRQEQGEEKHVGGLQAREGYAHAEHDQQAHQMPVAAAQDDRRQQEDTGAGIGRQPVNQNIHIREENGAAR